jgi:hypothetical protein
LKVHLYSLYRDTVKENNYIPGEDPIFLLVLHTDIMLSGENLEAAHGETTCIFKG